MNPLDSLASPIGATLVGATGGAWSTVQAFISYLVSSVGSLIVGFIQSGAGAVITNVQSRLRKTVLVTDFGAVGDGVVDDTPAIAAALTRAAGNKLKFPPGVYKFTSMNVPAGTDIEGDSFFGTVLLCSTATGDAVVLNSASHIRNLALSRQGTPTSGSHVAILGNKCSVSNVQFTNYCVGVTAGSLATNVISPLVENCNFFSPAVVVGGGGIFLLNYSNAFIKDNTLAGPSSGIQPDWGIRAHNGDTAFLTDNNVTLHGHALYMDVPAGLNNYAMRIVDCLFDSAGAITSVFNVPSAKLDPAGGIYDMLVSNTWFGLSTNGSGLEVTCSGAGTVDGLFLSNCQYVHNANAGVSFIGANVKNFAIHGGYASANSVYGLRVGPGVGQFTINGVTTGNISGRGANGRGINIDTGASDNYVVTNNRSQFNSVFNFFDGGTGSVKVVANNLT